MMALTLFSSMNSLYSCNQVVTAKVSLRLQHKFTKTEFGTDIGSISFNASAKEFLTTSKGYVNVWDTETGALKLRSNAYREITAAYFADDEGLLVTVGKEKSSSEFITKLWDANTGQLRTRLEGFIIFGPGKQRQENVAITTTGPELKFWQIPTGQLERTTRAYKIARSSWDFLLTSVISPDGRYVVARQGNKLPLWDTETGTLRAELNAPNDITMSRDYRGRALEIQQAKFSPNGETVATVDSYNRVELWQTDSGQLKATLIGHLDSIYSLNFSKDNRLLATASRDGTARVWHVSSGKLLWTLRGPKEIARRVKFSPDGSVLAVGYESRASLWDVTTGSLIADIPEQKDFKLSKAEFHFSPGSEVLLTVTDKTIKTWDSRTGRFITALADARPPFSFSKDGRLLVCLGEDGSVLIWQITGS